MDTPQLTADLLGDAGDTLAWPWVDAVLGPAADGGWWALGVRDVRLAAVLGGVPMSRPDTGDRTLAALRAAGGRVRTLPTLRDVDTMADALAVASVCRGTRFDAAVAALSGVAP
jgi:hypothetical protein